VRAALKAGLSPEEIRRAIDEAQAVRQEGGVAVANVGRRRLGLGEEEGEGDGRPSEGPQALVYIGSAAGCNAGGLLARYLEAASGLGLSAEELGEAAQVAQFVKERAADFLRGDVERALGKLAPTTAAAGGSASCCAPGCGG
jgi:alkylhydroperoxidase/carboxymuconolactone decarboxylase family protein YurZ